MGGEVFAGGKGRGEVAAVLFTGEPGLGTALLAGPSLLTAVGEVVS